MHVKICHIDIVGINFLKKFSYEGDCMVELLVGIFMFFNSESVYSEYRLINAATINNHPQVLYNFAMVELSLYSTNGVEVLECMLK